MQAPVFIQNFYQKRLIAKGPDTSLSRKEVVNLSDAEKIGIVYFLENENIYREVSGFVKSLQEKKKKVQAIGLVKDKYLTQSFLPKLSYDFIYEKNLNWFGRPSGKYVDEFVRREFDILIDLSNGDSFPVRYIMSRTRAKTKIGFFNEKNKEILDLFIKTDNYSDVKQLIIQIEYYLSIINKK